MKNQRKRRFFAVLIMCIFMFTMGTICSATADEDAAVLTIGAEESSIVTVGETEYDLADGDSALAYVDSYADNLIDCGYLSLDEVQDIVDSVIGQ